MVAAPFFGVVLHAIGGFAAGSFYVPLKKVEQWAWESFWLVMGLAAWIAAPWVMAWLTIPDLLNVLDAAPARAWGLCILFGLLWGCGNLTFGLSVRYLGMALGYALALGFCMAFGTLMPPLVAGTFGTILATKSGLVVLAGVVACLVGIGICGLAGMRKETELPVSEEGGGLREFSLAKGFAVAAMAGVLSACFAFGLAAGKPIAAAAVDSGARPIFSNNAVLVIILIGGFISNGLWCLILNIKNKTFGDYFGGAPGKQGRNYLLSALGGVTWFFQFFFYGMGTTMLGKKYDFSSWTIHMAFIIVFSNLWGLYFQEWKGTSRKTKGLVWAGILMLIVSTMVIGAGNYLAE